MRSWLMLGFGVLIIGLLNFGVVQKEQLIADGTPIYLELRPVDPRSLLQGDYMRLGFEVEQALQASLTENRLHSGEIVVSPDDNNVGQFVRVNKGTDLAQGEYLVHFTNVSWQPTLVPNSFLFQEGEATDFEMAEFAVLVFGSDRKDYVLRGLADENKQLINPRATLGF